MASLSNLLGRWVPAIVWDAPGELTESPSAPLLTRRRPLQRQLRDGTPVRLRLIDRRDRERLKVGFDRLSPASRYRRFFTPVPRLTEAMLDRLIETDDRDHVAVGAERGGFAIGTREGLGVARFIRLAEQPDTAEMAVAVIDDLQGRGLGRLLVQVLCRVARDRGVRRFRALVLPENLAMQDLIHELDPAAEIGSEDGVRTFTLLVPDVDLETIGATSSHGLLTFGRDVLAHRLRGLNPLAGRGLFAGEETRPSR